MLYKYIDKSRSCSLFIYVLNLLTIVATYNLIYNASLIVEETNNSALSLEGLVNTSGDSNLCFRPLEPKLEVGVALVWKKYKFLSRPAEIFLEKVREEFLNDLK